jgi:hypothetical protein
VKLKTVQNAIAHMFAEMPPPIATVGRGVKGDARRYRLSQPGLFPPNDDPLSARERGNNRSGPNGTVPDASRNNGNDPGEASESAYEDVAAAGWGEGEV